MHPYNRPDITDAPASQPSPDPKWPLVTEVLVQGQPLKTLATFRRDARGLIMFGQNIIPRTPGIVRAGDTIEVIERGATNIAFTQPGSAVAA